MDYISNELHIKQQKTRVILHNIPQTNRPNITFTNEPITEVSSNNEDTSNQSFKFLGFEIDEQLDFKSHIFKDSKKLITANFALHRLKNQLPLKQKLQVYNSKFKCHLEYGLPI